MGDATDDGLRPSPAPGGSRLLLGRQGIFDREDQLHGHEFFIRHEGLSSAWPEGVRTADAEHAATLRVLHAITAPAGGTAVSGSDQAVFVNASYEALADPAALPRRPARLVLEVTETVHVDRAVVVGIDRLRAQGVLIAIDDFRATPEQRRLLPLADYVKIDSRDLAADPFTFIEAARADHVRLVAKRIEDDGARRACELMGFTLFQGNAIEPTVVLDRGHEDPVATG